MSIKAPCMNCTDREVGCHGKCPKYKEFKELSDKNREELFKAKKLANESLNYIMVQREKARRSHR